VLPEEFRPLRQQKAARAAFGAADFQEQRIDLVLGLDGMRDPAVIVTGLVDQEDRGDADGDQHGKSRHQKQDLADRAPARSIRHGERHRQTGLVPP